MYMGDRHFHLSHLESSRCSEVNTDLKERNIYICIKGNHRAYFKITLDKRLKNNGFRFYTYKKTEII